MVFVDSIIRKRAKKSPRPKSWRWVLILVLFLIFIVLCLLGTNYFLSKIKLFTLFKNGKFLVLFQNNSELRSSGGFIGSYAVLEIRDYEVKNLTFNTNIYALDRAFAKENFVEPPEPLAKMLKGETWALRDANYNASFPEASQDILKFYHLETGENIDGIIALNAKVMIDILKITGPIKLPKYNLEITADNFYQKTQYQIEKAYFENPENWVLNEPKMILKDLYPEILKRALNHKLALWQMLKNETNDGEIFFNFSDPLKQNLVEKLHFAGKIPTDMELKDLFKIKSQADYLYINSNSFSGNKSSLSVGQAIDYQLTEDGSEMLRADLKISRIHRGSYEWPDGKNTNWLRVFTPPTSQFLAAKLNDKDISSGIQVGTDSGKNYFGIEIVTEPGQANILEISYLLPREDGYHLFVQKQPGEVRTSLKVNYEGKILFEGSLERNEAISK